MFKYLLIMVNLPLVYYNLTPNDLCLACKPDCSNAPEAAAPPESGGPSLFDIFGW